MDITKGVGTRINNRVYKYYRLYMEAIELENADDQVVVVTSSLWLNDKGIM